MAEEKDAEKKELTCSACKLPIRKGTLYTEGKNGETVHLRCIWGAIGEAIDAGAVIGANSPEEKEKPSKKSKKRRK